MAGMLEDSSAAAEVVSGISVVVEAVVAVVLVSPSAEGK